jgi:DNA-binding MarR family transcriptional regulator
MATNNRKKLFDATNMAGRELGTSSVMFHSCMAEKFGLTVTDWRARDLVVRHGPLAAGKLAELTGLTPGAVTGLIDRLVEAGVVRRIRDGQDRRKVLVEATFRPAEMQAIGLLFGPLMQATEKLYANYSDSQLRTIAGFMARMAELLREQTLLLREKKIGKAQ